MQNRFTAIAVMAAAALIFQGCDLSPTSPRPVQQEQGGLETASGHMGHGGGGGGGGNGGGGNGGGGGSNETWTFDIDVSGDVFGGGTDYLSSGGSNVDEIVINVNGNGANQVVLDLSSLDTSGCFTAVVPGNTNFKAGQSNAKKDPESAEMHYYFDADSDRFHLEVDGSFPPGTPAYWVSELGVGDSNTISGAGAAWTLTTSAGKGSKKPCAEGNLNYLITVTRTE